METADIIALMDNAVISESPLDLDAPKPKNAPVIGLSNSESSSTGSGTRFFDIRFNVKAPGRNGENVQLIINLEAQNDVAGDFSLLKRAVYLHLQVRMLKQCSAQKVVIETLNFYIECFNPAKIYISDVI